MSPRVDIRWCDIAESFVVAPLIVVLDESFDCFLQFSRHLVRHEADVPFDSTVVSFYLPVGLRMIRGSYDVSYAYQPQVFTKLPGDTSGAIV